MHNKNIILFIICGIIFGSTIISDTPNWNSDCYGTLVVSQNIIKNHTINLNKVKNYWEIYHGHYKHQIINISENNIVSIYPLGTPIISIPFVYLANLFGFNMLEHERLMQGIICSIIAIGIFLTIYIMAVQYFPFLFSIILGLFGFFGTTIGTVVGTGLWNLDYDILFSGIAILLIFLSVKKKNYLIVKNFEISSLFTGLFLFLSFISRPTAAVFILFILIYLFIIDRKYFLKTIITSGGLFIFYELVLFKLTGAILNIEYSSVSMYGLQNIKRALTGFFISPARGVIIFNPFLILTLLGSWLLFLKNKQEIKKNIKLLIGSILLSSCTLSILLLFWKDWYGGYSYGPRIYADAIYWCFLATIITYGEIVDLKIINIAEPSPKIIITLFLIIGFFINLQGIYNHYAIIWNDMPSVDKYPQVLFDWRFPQFLLMTHNKLSQKYSVQVDDINKNEFRLFKKACNGGDADGCKNLGVLYATGAGVEKDYSKAFVFFKKACDNWNGEGCKGLGILYANGLAVEKDFSKAIDLFKKSCDFEDADGCKGVGVMYANGSGVEKNYSKAFVFFKKACDDGNSEGCDNLGYMYYVGNGVEKDLSKASDIFKKACNGGEADGCNNYSILNQGN